MRTRRPPHNATVDDMAAGIRRRLYPTDEAEEDDASGGPERPVLVQSTQNRIKAFELVSTPSDGDGFCEEFLLPDEACLYISGRAEAFETDREKPQEKLGIWMTSLGMMLMMIRITSVVRRRVCRFDLIGAKSVLQLCTKPARTIAPMCPEPHTPRRMFSPLQRTTSCARRENTLKPYDEPASAAKSLAKGFGWEMAVRELRDGPYYVLSTRPLLVLGGLRDKSAHPSN